jgi:ribosomal protein S18 acetylase RimI-like enzyme
MDDGNVAGCGATYFHGKAGYMSCLAVKPEFRQQNIAKDLVKARIDFLRSNNVGHIINAVKESNTESLAVQSRSGYLPCAITEYWMPSSS